jgi:hypothetical protein
MVCLRYIIVNTMHKLMMAMMIIIIIIWFSTELFCATSPFWSSKTYLSIHFRIVQRLCILWNYIYANFDTLLFCILFTCLYQLFFRYYSTYVSIFSACSSCLILSFCILSRKVTPSNDFRSHRCSFYYISVPLPHNFALPLYYAVVTERRFTFYF